MNVMVKVIKCRNSKYRKLGFLHVLEQYLDRHMQDYYEKKPHLAYGMRLTNQFKKAMLQLMKLFEYEGQGPQIK